jgi:hypothetical protein
LFLTNEYHLNALAGIVVQASVLGGGGGEKDSEDFLKMLPLLSQQLGMHDGEIKPNPRTTTRNNTDKGPSPKDSANSTPSPSCNDTAAPTPPSAVAQVPEAPAEGVLREVEWEVKRIKAKSKVEANTGGQKLRLRAQLGLLPADANVDVEVGESSVRLSTSAVYKSIEMKFPGKIDRSSAVAKLKRSKGVLEVHATLIA